MVNVYAIVSIPLLFVLSFAGAALPALLAKWRPQWNLPQSPGFHVLNGMGAGALLSIGFVHSFAEGVVALEGAVESGVLPEYPWGGLFAMIGALLSLLVEVLVRRRLHVVARKRSLRMVSHGSSADMLCNSDSIDSANSTDNDSDAALDEDTLTKEQKDDIYFFTEMYVLLIGLSFHSLFVGFTLGLSDGDVGLFVAVLIHQVFEGFALGTRITKAGLRHSLQLLLIDFLFAVSTPLGIGVGLGVRSAIDDNPTTYEIVEGTFQSLSGGILIYLGLVHLIVEELQSKALQRSHKLLACFLCGTGVGLAALCVAAIWV
jgi:solute carrier family 39 (zinc transporter), member 1/2/3